MNILAQEQDSINSGNGHEIAKSSLAGKFQHIQSYLDSAARLKVDQRYIEVPDKPSSLGVRL